MLTEERVVEGGKLASAVTKMCTLFATEEVEMFTVKMTGANENWKSCKFLQMTAEHEFI